MIDKFHNQPYNNHSSFGEKSQFLSEPRYDMNQYVVTILPSGVSCTVVEGTTLLQALIKAGLHPDAPCGGKGTCGKCRVMLHGKEVLACQNIVSEDLTVTYDSPSKGNRILTQGRSVEIHPDGIDSYALAFDIGTTTVVCYLLDGHTGQLLGQSSCLNPQASFGGDVISRIQAVLDTQTDALRRCIQESMGHLTKNVCDQVGISPEAIGTAAIVGNTAMHHLLLGIDPKPLVTPPYMPQVRQAMTLPGKPLLGISGSIRILPNIAGFVGGDTVGCMASTRFDQLEDLTLMIDIGTNGEMVLGDRHRAIACSTAAGPAFEGAKISCGMRGADGAVDHVWTEDGVVRFHVIGDGTAQGLCGSGLLDLVASLLDLGILDESGYLPGGSYCLPDTKVVLTQKDVREVQLAKAAIRAGIELLCTQLQVDIPQIRQVYLAGAFGNYLSPASACRIGMIPPMLLDRIQPIGNAAGEGAKLSALKEEEFRYAEDLAHKTEFLELAGLPEFQDCYVDALEFSEEDEEP